MTRDEILFLFRMRFEILINRHNSRTDVLDCENLQKAEELYGYYRDYVMDKPGSLERAAKASII